MDGQTDGFSAIYSRIDWITINLVWCDSVDQDLQSECIQETGWPCGGANNTLRRTCQDCTISRYDNHTVECYRLMGTPFISCNMQDWGLHGKIQQVQQTSLEVDSICLANSLGCCALKSEQKGVKNFIIGQDSFAALPTGYDKSFCYAGLPSAFPWNVTSTTDANHYNRCQIYQI